MGIIQQGFNDVVNSGSSLATGKAMASSIIPISGKTGTAETYAALVKSLRLEVAELKEQLAKKPQAAPVSVTSEPAELGSTTSMTNFDILKRLNRLEKEVFGKQIAENSDF